MANIIKNYKNAMVGKDVILDSITPTIHWCGRCLTTIHVTTSDAESYLNVCSVKGHHTELVQQRDSCSDLFALIPIGPHDICLLFSIL